MAKAKPKTPKPITDVAKPNDSPPSPTSKPVIITHRPMMRDPMMTAPTPSTAAPAPVTESATVVSRQKTIAPPSEAPLPVVDVMTQSSGASSEPAEQPTESQPAPVETAAVLNSSIPETYPKTDKKDESILSPDAIEAIEEDKDKEQLAKVEALIASQQYFLPIGASELKKARRFMALGIVVIILLAVAWAAVALDAGLVKIDGVKAPTHFFSN